MAITTARLLRGIKRRITVPANQQLIDDPGMLELADDIMKDYMVPLIVSTRQNYFVVTDTQTVTESQAAYDIPYRYVGRTLRDIKYSYDGTSTGIKDLTMVALEDEHLFAQEGQPGAFYFKGDQIVLVPAPIDDTQYIQFWGELAPSLLCETDDAAQITAVSAGVSTTTVTVSSLPSTMTAGVDIDFVQGKSGCRILAFDKEISSIGTLTLVFDNDDVPDALAAGDWIAIAQQTPILQVPDECYPLYETKVCARVLFAVGDFEGSTKLDNDDAVKQETSLKKLLEPRIQGAQTKIVNRNGLLRGRGLPFWRGRGLYG